MNEVDALRRQDDLRMTAFEKNLNEMSLDIRNIKENHLAHIERDLNIVTNDMDWLKRFFWLLAGATVSSLVVNIISLIIHGI